MNQNTLVLIKPDGVRRRMIGQIVGAIESRSLSILHLQQRTLSTAEAELLYLEHKGKWHFARNIKHVISGPVVVIHVCGEEALSRCRQLVESIREAHKDVIKLPKNIAHATSDLDKAENELGAVGCQL